MQRSKLSGIAPAIGFRNGQTLPVDSDPLEAIDETVGWAALLGARHEVDALTETAGVDPLLVAADRYATLKKFAPMQIDALEFKAGRGSARTITGIRISAS